MQPLVACIEGIGWWSPGAPDWNTAARRLRNEDGSAQLESGIKPPARRLPPNERRRAPVTVLLACEVSEQACTMAARDPAELACVFASAHGDTAIIDHLCATLAAEPLHVSPTQFHNSVLNAPAGYWTIATQCRAPSNAVSAGHASFAAGLLEAAVLANAESSPVLFAAYDIAAQGATADVVGDRNGGAVALVIAPERTTATLATVRLRHVAQSESSSVTPTAQPALATADLIAAALPLFAALAGAGPATLHLPASAHSALAVEVLR